MIERHSWKDAAGQPWSPASASDACARCGRTPDAHRPDCGEVLGKRLIGPPWRWVPAFCTDPAKIRGDDGLMRCTQHDRISRGLPGKWTNPPPSSKKDGARKEGRM